MSETAPARGPQTLAEAFTAPRNQVVPNLAGMAFAESWYKEVSQQQRQLLAVALTQPAVTNHVQTVVAAMEPLVAAHARNSKILDNSGKRRGRPLAEAFVTGGSAKTFSNPIATATVQQTAAKIAATHTKTLAAIALPAFAAQAHTIAEQLQPVLVAYAQQNKVAETFFQARKVAQLFVAATAAVDTAKWAGLYGQVSRTQWASIAEQLDFDWSPPTLTPIRHRVLRPVPAAPKPAEPIPTESDLETGWWSNPRLAACTLAFAACVVFVVETRMILGAEVWREVRDDSAWVATYTAVLGALFYAVWSAANRRR